MAERELSFGEYLTQLREAKDVTLRELARKIGVSAPFLSDVEKNRRAPLTAERLEKVAAVLGLSEVIIVYSANFPDTSPMRGLLFLSLSPPHPNTQITLPIVYVFTVSKILFRLSGV